MSAFLEHSIRRFTLPCAALLGLGIALVQPTNPRFENTLNRTFPRHLSPQVIVIGIDDNSLRDYGRMEIWPRALYTQAIRTLTDAGVTAVGLDVLLSDPSQGDSELNKTLGQANVIRGIAPDDAAINHPNWKTTMGISALNAPRGGGVAEVQTAYATQQGGALVPSFARQVAAAAGKPLPLSATPQLMPYISPEEVLQQAISFRDVVNGNFRFGSVQSRVAIIGLTATGILGNGVPDLDGRLVPGVVLQARAVSAFLEKPLMRIPLWLTALLCMLVACAVILTGGLWGFIIAAVLLLIAGVLWQNQIVIPGVTISMAAVLATMLVAYERWRNLRNLGTRDPLTGFGNRLAFTRAVEHRWNSRGVRPLSLVLMDINDLRRVTDQVGRLAGEETLHELAQRLQQTKRRNDVIFRWGPDEFAVLLDQISGEDLPGVVARYEQNLQQIRCRDLNLSVNVGGAATGAAIQTPHDLIEAASRDRYRRKHQREQERHLQ